METELERLQNTGAISPFARRDAQARERRPRTVPLRFPQVRRRQQRLDGQWIMEKVRSGSDKLSEQAADKARGFVGQGIERSAETLANVGKLVGDTASGLDERLGSRNMAIMPVVRPRPLRAPPTRLLPRIPTS
jgi:hypothetical protein